MSSPSAPSASGGPATLAASGDLSTTRAEDVLLFCERVRFSGTLGFQAPEGRGILPMLCGEPEIAPGDEKLESALDEFLALDHGTYALTQLLPPLTGARAESELRLRGSLESQTPADLLRYCEGAGLTGTLTLRRDEKSYVARYLRGELQSVTIDDEADADLARVFAWDRGSYDIAAKSVFERDRKPTLPTEPLLKTLEVALTQILDQSQRGAALIRPNAEAPAKPSILRGATQPFGVQRTAGSPLRAPTNPPRPRSIAPPAPSAETTVKVYLVDKAGPRGPSQTQHASGKLGSEVIPLDPQSQRLSALTGDAARPDDAPAESPSEPKPLVVTDNASVAPPPDESAPARGPGASKAWSTALALVVVATSAAAIYIVATLVR